MERVRDHPKWWVILLLDGFQSHLEPKALEVFAKNKILIVKEEGDTSQVSQAYDQEVAKEDKRWARELLDSYKFAVKDTVSQWDLIIIANAAFNEVTKGGSWRRSFISVNMCPSQRKLFKQHVIR